MLLDKLSQLRAPSRNPRWYLVSVAIHLVLLGGLLLLFRPRAQERRTVSLIDLGLPEEIEIPAYVASGRGGGDSALSGKPVRMVTRAETPLPVVSAPPTAVGPSTAAAPEPGEGEGADTAIGTHRQLGPDYADGRLWARVTDAAGGRVPAKGGVDSLPRHIAKVDSVLAARIKAYLDTVPVDSFTTREAPKWTTEIAGKTWGLDGKYIYLGGVKIPTAILAMLPVPDQAAGNYDGQQAAARTNAMRRDILEAAERAANAVEFKKYVKELRERKDMERRQREKPEPLPPPPAPQPPQPAPDTVAREPLIP